MKKRIILISILTLALVSLCAFASAAVTVGGYSEAQFRIGLPTERPDGGGWFSRGIEFHYAINDQYTEPAAGTTVAWSVAPVNGGPALSIRADGPGRDSIWAWLNLDPSVTYTTGGPYTYRISMDVNGSMTVTRDVAITFVNDALPTGYGLTVTPVTLTDTGATLGTAVRMTNGEISMTTGNIYVVSTVAEGTDLGYQTNERGWGETEWEEIYPWDDNRYENLGIDYGKSGVYRAKRPGIYEHDYVMTFYSNVTGVSNLGCYIPYTLKLYDANGSLPGPALDTAEFEGTWYLGLPAEYTGSGGVYGRSSFGQMWSPERVRDYSDLNIQWELLHVSGPDNFQLCYSPNNDWKDSYFYAEVQPKSGITLTAGTSVYTMKATYKGVTYEGTMTIHTADASQAPTGLTVRYAEFNTNTGAVGTYTTVGSNGEIIIQEGKTYVFSGEFTGSTAGISGEYWLNFWGNDGINEMNRWDYRDSQGNALFGSSDMLVEGNEPGIYYTGANLSIGYSNLEASLNLTLKVKDENGNLPAPKLFNAPAEITWHTDLPADQGQAGAYSVYSACEMSVPWNDRDYSDLSTVWSLELVNGEDNFVLEHNPNPDWGDTYFCASIRPKDGTLTAGESVYRMKCSYRGKTYEGLITAHTVSGVQLPTALNAKVYRTNAGGTVIGDEIGITNGILTVKAGDCFYCNANMNGSYPGQAGDEQYLNITYYDSDTYNYMGNWAGTPDSARGIYHNNTLMLTTQHPGEYPIVLWMNPSGTNFAVRYPVTLRVTDENGNIPKPAPRLSGNYYWADDEDREIDYTVYTGIGTNSSELIWNRWECINFHISNYEELQSKIGGQPAWTVTTVSGNVDYVWNVSDDANHIWGGLNNIPEQPTEAKIRIDCTWGSETVSRTINLHVVDPDFSLPTGLDNLSDVIDTQVGQTLTITPSVLPANWGISGVTPRYFASGNHWQFMDEDWDWQSDTSARYEVHTAGIYRDTIGFAYGALMVTKQVTFQVKNVNGVLPSATLTLTSNFQNPINRYLGLTRAIEEQDGVFSWNALGDARIDSDVYEAMQNQYGGEPSWTVSQTSGDPLPFTWSVESFDGTELVDLRLEAQDLVNLNCQPGTAEITITCTWGDQSVSRVQQVFIKQLPNGRPDGIDYNNGSDTVECQVGDILVIEPTILPRNWGGIPGYDSEYAGNSGEFERFCNIQSEGPAGKTVEVTRAGIYQCFVGVGTDTVTAGRWITYRVKDANGQIPVPEIRIGRNRPSDEITLYLGMDYTDGVFYNSRPQTEPQVDHFYYHEGEEDLTLYYPNDTAIWGLTRIQGTAELRMETGWEDMPYDMDLVLKKLPDGPEDAIYRITCDWGDAHWEKTITIHFVNSPTGMPTGIDLAFGDTLVVKSGERIGMADRVSFKKGWSIPGYPLGTSIGGGNNWQDGVTHDANWIWDVANMPGVYDCNVSKDCANVRWFEDFTLIVTEADGTLDKSLYTPVGAVWKLPANTTTIESEAFAGTPIRQIDIPIGVTSIADDAFDGCGLIAVYAHNQYVIDWAAEHGVAALVD